MNKEGFKMIGWLLYVCIIIVMTWYFFDHFSATKVDENSINTVVNEPQPDLSEHTLTILSEPLIVNDLTLDKYPEITINSKVENVQIYFEVKPIDKIKDYEYFDSNKYFFAFRFFVGDFGNGGYYKVFRNSMNGVSNDLDLGLNGAIPGVKLKDGYKWNINLDNAVPIARSKDSYGYATLNLESYLNNSVGKTITVGGYLSSIKEYPKGGRNITEIKKIVIIYDGEKGAISLK